MKYLPSLAVKRTKGPRPEQKPDGLTLFGAALRRRELDELERKYGNDRRLNPVILVRR